MIELAIYHHGCPDGVCSAWLVKKFYPEAEIFGARHGDEPPDVKGKRVLVVDFSYPRETLLRMYQEARHLRVLDHHKTAEDALRGLPFCEFNMNECGASLTLEYLSHLVEGRSIPYQRAIRRIVAWVKDRDLWRWEVGGSREFSAYLRIFPLTIETFDQMERMLVKAPSGIPMKGAVVLQAIDQEVENHVRQARVVRLGGYVVPAVNASVYPSEIAGKLAEDAPFGVCWQVRLDFEDPCVLFSLRSRGTFDVSIVALEYGGGGHRNAAGFRMSLNDFARWMLTERLA